MKRTCKQCGKEFFISQSEISFYKGRNLQIPRRCKECREANKQQPAEVKGKEEKDYYKDRERTEKKENREKAENAVNTHTTEALKTTQAAPKVSYGAGQKDEQPDRKITSEAIGKTAGRTGGKKPGFAAKLLAFAAVAVILITGQIVPKSSDNEPQAETAGKVYVDSSLTFRSEEYLNDHYQKHGIEMGFSSAEEYQTAAAAVVGSQDALHKTEAEDGDDVYYIEKTNEFVIVSTDGFIRTYFHPDDGIDYFNRQ